MMQELRSKIDASINYVEKNLTGFIEARYVRRKDDYFVCYLSSQSGCNRGCGFCHLTITKQTTFIDVDKEGFIKQADKVFEHYLQDEKANKTKYVHFNFMARGEPLENKALNDDILLSLASKAISYKLIPKFNISTIIPNSFKGKLSDLFKIVTPTIYYSMYSVDPVFRRKWLPAAMPVDQALELLREYQYASKKIIKIHFAFIKGENDSPESIDEMCNLILKNKLLTEFNIVRYNPFSEEQGEESSEETINSNVELIKNRIGDRVKIITRVGLDVKASCGTFVE